MQLVWRRLPDEILQQFAQSGPGGTWAPQFFKKTKAGYYPMPGAQMVPYAQAGMMTFAGRGAAPGLRSRLRGGPLSDALVLERLASPAGEMYAKELEQNISRRLWIERLNRAPFALEARLASSWDAGYLNRVRHPISTIQSAYATRQIATKAMTEQAAMATYGGAIGNVGMVTGQSALTAIMPYILGAAVLAGIVAMVVAMFRGPAKGSGTTNVANVTINGNVGANTEQITAAVQQGLASAARQAEIAQAESAVRRGYLQPEMAGA